MKLPDAPPSPPLSPETFSKVVPLLTTLGVGPKGAYLHWSELQRREPPEGLSHEEWWLGLSLNRQSLRKETPLPIPSQSESFGYAMNDDANQRTHLIDKNACGSIEAPEAITNTATQKKYLIHSLIEEALTSSQLEGAVATAKDAKELIEAGRKPKNRSETMVLNNYAAMQFIRENKDTPLSISLIQELHTIITNETLDDPQDAGRIRNANDTITIVDHSDNTTLHTPPPAKQLPQRIQALCDFANGGGKGFTHPVIRAIFIHFWLAYDHPFCDGNGRTARALFYWSMLHEGYWLTQYISISRILKKSHRKYLNSFLYSETRPYDATYFVNHQLQVIERSIDDLHAYLQAKVNALHRTESKIRENQQFNHRQLSLLSEALKDPRRDFTVKRHRESHGISHETARRDIYGLRDKGLFTVRKRGREMVFRAIANLEEALEAL